MSTPSRSILAAAILLIVGCQSKDNPAPELLSVTPSPVSNLARVQVSLDGSNLFTYATASFSNDDPPRVDRGWTVALDGVAISADDVTYVSPIQIDVIIPADLAVGTHQLVATSPTGISTNSVEIEVVDSLLGFAITIETEPDGSGTVVGNRGLSAGDELIVHAVVRDGDGAFLGTVDANWAVTGGIGVITSAPTATATFTAQTVGSGQITAAAADLEDADTGTISVNAGPATRVTAETAPGGMGTLVGARTLSSDDTLPLFAISRDSFGNFVADEPVAWSVLGGIGTIPAGPSISAMFDPTTVGSGTVEISHASLPTTGTGALTVTAGVVASFVVAPDTAFSYLGGGPTIAFTVTDPRDADNNPTADLGTIVWSAAGIATIDSGTGVLTPTLAGRGSVTATSSHGASDSSGDVNVYPSGLIISSVTVPSLVTRGQLGVAIDVNIVNATSEPATLIDVALGFAQAATDVSGDYVLTYDYRNPTVVAPGNNTVVRYFANVGLVAALGGVDITADLLGYMQTSKAFATDNELASWTVNDLALPTAVISAPLYPNNKICVGQPVSFGGSTSVGAVGYAWDLTGASPATSSVADPAGVTYSAAGDYPFALSVAGANGTVDTALGPTPMFVGDSAGSPHVTGEIRFEDPSLPGEAADIGTLPKIDMAGDGDPTNLSTCDGAPLLETDPNAYATVFVDRGEIDPARDVRPLIPGVQVELHAGTHFDDVVWRAVTPMTEGKAFVYAEYRRESDGAVTAAGWLPVVTTDDDIDPSIDATLPTAPCNTACFGKGEQWLIRFDEPMNAAALEAGTLVQVSSGDCATGILTDITATSTIAYDATTRTLAVIPAVQAAASYSVIIEIDKDVVWDASSNANNLSNDFALCATLEDRAAPATPALPAITTISFDPVTPDGDGDGESAKFDLVVDAATSVLRLEIERGATSFYTSLTPGPGPGNASVVWNGRDGTGRVLPNGYYVYRITPENAVGVAGPAVIGVIEVRSAVGFVGLPRWK